MLDYSQTQKKLVFTELDPKPLFPPELWSKPVTSRKFKKEYKIIEMMVNNGVINYVCVEQNVQGNAVRQTFVLPERDLIYSAEMEKEYRSFDVLLINEAPVNVIKDFLLKFWISYPQENIEVRREYESKIKAGGKTGLPNIIADERKVGGRFTSKDDFTIRMQNRYNEFPWRQFSEIIEA